MDHLVSWDVCLSGDCLSDTCMAYLVSLHWRAIIRLMRTCVRIVCVWVCSTMRHLNYANNTWHYVCWPAIDKHLSLSVSLEIFFGALRLPRATWNFSFHSVLIKTQSFTAVPSPSDRVLLLLLCSTKFTQVSLDFNWQSNTSSTIILCRINPSNRFNDSLPVNDFASNIVLFAFVVSLTFILLFYFCQFFFEKKRNDDLITQTAIFSIFCDFLTVQVYEL